MDPPSTPRVARPRSRSADGQGTDKAQERFRTNSKAVRTNEGAALGTMIVQADNVTMTINFNF